MTDPSTPQTRQEGTDGPQSAPQASGGPEPGRGAADAADGRTAALDYDALAETEVQRRCPRLDPSASRGDARTRRALVRYLATVLECNDLRRQGIRNAPELIAERRGVAPATVRTWLHRAKAAFGDEVVPAPTARRLLRDRYAEVIRRVLPEQADRLANELIAIRDTEIERLMYPPTDPTGATL